MEAHTQAVEDHLIDGLSYKMQPGSSYVVERKNTTFWASGNVFAPNGVKVIRLQLTGDTWLDPTTIKIAFDVLNNDTTAGHDLKPLGQPFLFFRRARVLCGSALIEDIDEFGRWSQQMHMLQPETKRANDFVDGFDGERFDKDTPVPSTTVKGVDEMQFIPPGERATCMFSPYLGILTQDRYLPLRYAPITIELEICNLQTEPIVEPSGDRHTAAKTSTNWQIENVKVFADTIMLDNELDNQFAEHLLSGNTMPIQFSSYTNQTQSVLSPDIFLNISRAVTRLKDIYVSFYGPPDPIGSDAAAKTANLAFQQAWRKRVNYFKHPTGNKNDLELQLTIGSKIYPDFPIKSSAEFFYRLECALGVQDNSFSDIDISQYNYMRNRFVIGLNLETIINSSFTGVSTKVGDL